MTTKVKPFSIGGLVLYAVDEGSHPNATDLSQEPSQTLGGSMKKALPKKSKEKPVKQAKTGKASSKKAGATGKTRYGYPQEGAGGGQPVAPPQPNPVQTPPEPQKPQADPADLANQLGMSLHTLQRIAQRFVDNKSLGGRKGFVGFMKTKLKEVADKHRLDGDYFGLIYTALVGENA